MPVETLLTFNKPILFEIPQRYRARIVAQLLIDELEFGTPHPIDDYGLYPVLKGDNLECLDYDALLALYQPPGRHLYLESVVGSGEREYTLNIVEYRVPRAMALLGQHPTDESQWEIVKHPLRYQAKHGDYEITRQGTRHTELKG